MNAYDRVPNSPGVFQNQGLRLFNGWVRFIGSACRYQVHCRGRHGGVEILRSVGLDECTL